MTPAEWLRYANSGAIRNKPLDPRLVEALRFLPAMGITMEVFSGGQDAKGAGTRRTGSTRHDDGGAADVMFYKDGKLLDWANPKDVPVFESIVQAASKAGVTGFGAGPEYMRPGSMHLGYGPKAVWGAGGSGASAPEWLRAAAGVAGPSTAGPTGPTGPSAPQQSAPPNPMDRPQMAFSDRIRGIFDGTYKPDTKKISDGIAEAFAPTEMKVPQLQPGQAYQAPDSIARAYQLLQRGRMF